GFVRRLGSSSSSTAAKKASRSRWAMIMLESLDTGPSGTCLAAPYEVHVRARPHPGGGLHPPPTALDATPGKRHRLCRFGTEKPMSGKYPFVAADDRHRGSSGFHSVDVDLGAADHEVGVHTRRVRSAFRKLDLGVPCKGQP